MKLGLAGIVTLSAWTASCAALMGHVEQYSDPNDDAALAQCRKHMREAREAGADASNAYGVYYTCTEDAGLRK